MPPDRYLSPMTVARRLGVRDSIVYAWLRSGELRGVNVARRITARPRFRVSPEALAEFENRRSAAVMKPAANMTRRKAKPATVEFY